jgi:hypothetical protein
MSILIIGPCSSYIVAFVNDWMRRVCGVTLDGGQLEGYKSLLNMAMQPARYTRG